MLRIEASRQAGGDGMWNLNAGAELTPPSTARRPARSTRRARAARSAAAWRRETYWEATRRPLACLLFLGPLIVAYETGVRSLGGYHPDALRNGADAWMRGMLATLGLRQWYLPPLGVGVLFLVWHVAARHPWRMPLRVLLGMVVESVLFSLVLIGLNRFQDLLFQQLEQSHWGVAASMAPDATQRSLVLFLGAGIYEEVIFRLILVPSLYWSLRAIRLPSVVAITIALSGSSVLFSLAHYMGMAAEPFTWFTFIFRWLAGLYFAGLFVGRGFGVAAGTHAAYDILVGVFHWHL